MVTTDALHIERGLVLVERRCRQVQHAVVQRLVLQNVVNGVRLLHGCLTHRLRHKHLVVQVALVHLPHVHQTQHRQHTHHHFLAYLIILIQQQHGCAHDDDPERTPAVSRKHGDTHVRQVLRQRFQVLGRQLAQLLSLGGADKVAEEHLRHQRKQQGHTCRQGKRRVQPRGLRFQQLWLVHDFLQCQQCQQGYGKLRNDEYRRYRSELRIHRYVVDE